jgi:hypothetical protein
MMFYQDESGQLSLVKPEKVNKKFEFFGNVYVNESLRETRALKTEAPSLKKAINNLKWRLAQDYGYGNKTSVIFIDPSNIKEVAE